jgi:reactive intermediate/imine deaminase
MSAKVFAAALLGALAGGGIVLAALQLAPQTPVMQLLDPAGNQQLGLPFSEAVRVGDLLYLSGQIGAKPGTLELVPGGIQAETRQTMLNIRDTLQRHGSSLDNVVKCTVFLARMEDWPAMNEVYTEMFGPHRPARTAMGVNGLALDGSLEMECIALVDA